MTKEQRTREVLKACGYTMAIEAEDFGDDHEFVLNIDSLFYFGFYKTDGTYYVQRIISNPGTYHEPPSEDYEEVFSSPDFSLAILALTKEITQHALSQWSDHG